MTAKELYHWAVENECEDKEIKMSIPHDFMHCGFWETEYEHEAVDDVDAYLNEKNELEVVLHS